MRPLDLARRVIQLVALGLVLVAIASAPGEAPRGAEPLAALVRSGESRDLLCDLARKWEGPGLGDTGDLAPACPGPPGESRARVVDLRDDRRRSLLLGIGETLRPEIDPGDASFLRFWLASPVRQGPLRIRASLGHDESIDRIDETIGARRGWVSVELRVPPGADGSLRLEIDVQATRVSQEDSYVAMAAPRLVRPPDPRDRSTPNVIVYLIDTLRADHTPMYGYERNTMPRLAGLSDKIIFERAYSTAARTRPAAASALTGLYPCANHARLGRGLDHSIETLAETLRASGWSTAAFVANGNVFAPEYAFEQGFDRFVAVRGQRRDNHAYTEEINELLLPAVRALSDEPFFLYIHSVDPHSPYDPPPAYAGRFRDPDYDGPITPRTTRSRLLRKSVQTPSDVAFVRDLYDEDILYQDSELGRLIDILEDEDLLEKTVLIVVSDHGEEFAEHGDWEHGNRLFQEQIRIPFVLRIPGRGDTRLDTPISLADLPPTLLGLFGLRSATGTQGRDLSTLVLRGNEQATWAVYAEEVTNIPGGDLQTLVAGDWKLIRRADGTAEDGSVSYSLFHLGDDPGEQKDRSASEPEKVRRLRKALRERGKGLYRNKPPMRSAVRIDEQTLRQLRALGYLEGE